MGSYDDAIFNTECCILVKIACRFNYAKKQNTCLISIVKEWEQELAKYTENYRSKLAICHNAADQTFELILQFVLLFRYISYIQMNLKSISSL
jgi:hypothetical protein